MIKKLYVWPDGQWSFLSDVEDIAWHCESMDLEEDYLITEVPEDLDVEDIDELIGLKALPGMLSKPVKNNSINMPVTLDENSVLVISFEDFDPNSHMEIDKGTVFISGKGITFQVGEDDEQTS